ncbi:hypothetical protein B0J17DRAFT_721813 [Rhizoctonia solani]|nr:hypothetical protein B0J17DRAFT_721813 [Rhizoctonia solani]
MVHHSTRLTQRESNVLRKKADAVLDCYNELVIDGGQDELDLWVKQQRRVTNKRRTMALELRKFLDTLNKELNARRNNLKAARRAEPGFRKEWLALVENPKQLTERIWTNLYSKLQVLLTANREARLNQERAERQQARKSCLDRFLSDINHNTPPLPEFRLSHTPSSYLDHYTYEDIFPDADLSAKDFGKRLHKNKDKIIVLLAQWQDTVRGHMVGLLRTESRPPHSTIHPPESVDSDPFIDLSDDFKLLLRADSLFYLTGPRDGVKVPFNYREAFEAGHSIYCHDRDGLWVGGPRDPVDLDRFRRYSRAQNMARVILRDMGRPDASFFRDGSGEIQHYMEQARVYASVQGYASKLARRGIAYNDVHDPASDEDRPMIQLVPLRILHKKVFPMRKYNLCVTSPIALSVVVSERKMLTRDIDEPELGGHYDVSAKSTFRFKAGFGYDYRDADDEEPDWEVITDGPRNGSGGEESGGEEGRGDEQGGDAEDEIGTEDESDGDEHDGEGQQWVNGFWFFHNGEWIQP